MAKTVSMTLRLPPEVKASLEATAARTHRSQQAVAIEAIAKATSGHEQRISDAARRIVERDRAILNRLA
ncbi:CopG family transcriptional regulator [Cellulomonas oligotrophica]|uniref:Putative transcriptional regulator n=1 Tax=Cellulomonas oligotrophica TaxID=931536 RepID=A0A7Y9JXR2_9CELL|nr:CopG family transcriptional regulator [Cellulomonas oligotrophica]NYD85922.1 putative transcriptional regulator [Cellulomonas oligotrophica]GIG31070.1 hypothetical protein Col01nite_02290 [Cellulomonas oligotrophica]